MSDQSLYAPMLLSEAEFRKLASFIEKSVGIKMPEQKRLMMQSRLTSRLKALHLTSFKEYIEYVFSGKDTDNNEVIMMIDAMTTNLTEFFREAQHFDYMTNSVLPRFAQEGRSRIKLWSAGCSTGQEPYTLSIVMSEFISRNPGKITDFSVLATDVSTKVLNKAQTAIYPMEAIQNIPLDLKRQYFLKSKNPQTAEVRLKPAIRNRVTFSRLNFMDDDFGFRDTMQIIFCRNVLIYFDKNTQEAVIKKFMQYLEPGGYLFLGHSETIFGMDLPLKTVAPTVFQRI
ncbi:CheR family methyltransferase [Treponema brennaborense]|uniref:protein-glutamate O-methyltransferase n=1 Tax=Treponema brennaborense (strain DSM 12168 / CIP 105900 / DD5/3) TaxID=906968 RepID=F4LKU7_TREBD|nr:protein-glutamate O-methyltransferase [Treponema brennaborense]AEE15558.1 MCP methyltransferase, CheR-type [Treponema brennaborense DSM 12168]